MVRGALVLILLWGDTFDVAPIEPDLIALSIHVLLLLLIFDPHELCLAHCYTGLVSCFLDLF